MVYVPADRRYAQLSFPVLVPWKKLENPRLLNLNSSTTFMEETPTKNNLGIEGGVTFAGNWEVTSSRTAPKGVAVAQKIGAPR